MKKQYSSAALEVVQLRHHDILTISITADSQSNEAALSAGRRFDVSDDWDAGY